MAINCFSSKDIHIEAYFAETDNICICSRAHLKDCYALEDNYNICDNEIGCEDVTEETESVDSCDETLKDTCEDPDILYENALMKSMGLPTSFGKQTIIEHENSYSTDNLNDEYKDNCGSESEESLNLKKSQQNEEQSNSNNLNNFRDFSYYSKAGVIRNFKKHLESDNEFENFWSLHGYTICLNSWIKKKKEYISSSEYFGGLHDHNSLGEGTEVNSLCFSDNDSSEIQKYTLTNIKNVHNCKSFKTSHGDKTNLSQSSGDNNVSFSYFNIFKNQMKKCNENIANLIENWHYDNKHKNNYTLKNMNKFQHISVPIKYQTKCISNRNVASDDNETSIIENLENLEINLENSDLYVENVLSPDEDLTVSDEDLTLNEFQSIQNELLGIQNKSIINENDKLENVSGFGTLLQQESYFEKNRRVLKRLSHNFYHVKHTKNPLFMYTTSEKEYVERVSKSQSWGELWASHCQEEYDKHSKFFSENSTMFQKYFISNSNKCKFCRSGVCNLDSKNSVKHCYDDLLSKLVSCKDTKSNLRYYRNEIITYPVFDSYVSKDLPIPENIVALDCSDATKQDYDEDPPIELPIKRSYEVESEDENAGDMIKELGLVLQPTNDLKIKKKKKNKRRRLHKSYKRHRSLCGLDDDERINKLRRKWFLLDPESQDINANNDNSEADSSKLAAIESEASNENENRKCEESEPAESIDYINKAVSLSHHRSCENDFALNKYWHQRYRLFSRFNEGIKLDEESWFSVTPEKIARHIAKRCACGIIVDAFCGAGGNAIQFASYCHHVIAIDIDPKKIELAKHNATIYGVADNIDFIVGDYFDIAPLLKADGVFLSPPWGGPSYAKHAEYDIGKIEPNIYKTFEVSRRITQNIALFVPKNSIVNQLVQLSGEGNSVEIEQNFLNKKVKTITAYYGDFVSHSVTDNVRNCQT